MEAEPTGSKQSIRWIMKMKLLMNLLEIDSLGGNNLNVWADEEDSARRKRDDVVESLLLHIDHLQHVAGGSAENPCIFYNEELLLLGGPEQSPRGRQWFVCGDGIAADGGQGVDGVDYLGKLLGIGLGLEAAVFAGDEAEEVALGRGGGGLGLVCEGRAGHSQGGGGAPAWVGEGGKKKAVGRHVDLAALEEISPFIQTNKEKSIFT